MSDGHPGLQFGCDRFATEIEALEEVARDFLEPTSTDVLKAFEEQVAALRTTKGEAQLSIEPERPIRTMPTGGAHERGKARYTSLRADISCIWEVRTLGMPAKKAAADRLFEIAGKASTTVDLYLSTPDVKGDCRVASWRMELGVGDAPGAFFHAQIPDTRDRIEEEFAMWPTWLSVPRLPTPPFTPMAAVEYTLGEIFQSKWRDHVDDIGSIVKQSMLQQWVKLQHDKFERFLDWQRRALRDAAHGTPLQSLKCATPEWELFEPDWKPIQRRR